jgi:hypothetical protein
MEGAYINLRYFNSKIALDYHFSKFISKTYRSSGITSKFNNLREVKNQILKFIKSSPENEIIIQSVLAPSVGEFSSKYKKINKPILEKLIISLNEKQSKIIFKVA